jgi:ABC-2 type transport system ATP-binding protein
MMSEIAQTAEQLIVVGRGRLIAATSVADIVAEASTDASVLVRTPQAGALRDALAGLNVTVTSSDRDLLEVRGVSSSAIGETAARPGVVLHELTPLKASLEDAFMRLTGDSVEYHAGATPELRDAA